MRMTRWAAGVAGSLALVAVLGAPAGASRPVADGSFVGDWLYYAPGGSTCSIGIEYDWQLANGIDKAVVQFQMKTPSATTWANVGAPREYNPRMRVPRTYSFTTGLDLTVTGTQHVFRAIGETYTHRGTAIPGTYAVSSTSPTYTCG